MLDVGYVLAPSAWHAAVVAAAPGPIVGVDVLPAEVPGYEGVVADVRALPLEAETIDLAFCISTLEHVGADRRWRGRSSAVRALRELRRVLRPGGRLLLTVPCGAAERHEGFVQREPESWLRLFAAASLDVVEEERYVCDELGWHGAEHARGVRYDVERGRARAVLCVELRRTG